MTYHVLPVNDLKEHTEDTICECRPKVIFENGNMIIVHNSYDHRELKEMFVDECKSQMTLN